MRVYLNRGLIIPVAIGLTIFCLSQSYAMQSNQSPDRVWRKLNKVSVTLSAARIEELQRRIPVGVEYVQLDLRRLSRILNPGLAEAGRGTTPQRPGTIEITLPLPDGTYPRFRVEESSIMGPELERQFPNFKSYRGQGIDDPTMTVRFSQTPKGFHAIILTPDRSFYIDPFPLRSSDLETHVTYRKSGDVVDDKRFECLVPEDNQGTANRDANRSIPASNGDTLRTYRLAVAATGEYSQFHGGTVQGAFQAIYNTIDRVNSIYERDLAIHLQLVDDQTKIIYTEPATDPYTNSDVESLLAENQTNLDHVIGSAEYDIGHVFGVGSGGMATLRSVGRNGSKARGATGSKRPVGDPFDVDYVAHEMGHQFGANHTFNATTRSCSNGNRNRSTAYEPGSGSTIMAYAGICGQSDLQLNSDDYFHAASVEEILDYITSDAVRSVPTITPTNNRPPTIVVTGREFTIPKSTPFTLRATGTDFDGDALTYTWEQFDLGEPSPPENDLDVLRPLFRSFPPARTSVRFFPRIESLASGRLDLGESLPNRQRVMNFRVSARDNRANGGGISFATAAVSVITDSEPFVVTQPTASTEWQAGSSQEVTWELAGTRLAPINCSHVRISLSVDEGKTFNVIVANTPNDGSETITVPANTTTAKARIMVEAVDNVFFNVSRGDFRIVPSEISRSSQQPSVKQRAVSRH